MYNLELNKRPLPPLTKFVNGKKLKKDLQIIEDYLEKGWQILADYPNGGKPFLYDPKDEDGEMIDISEDSVHYLLFHRVIINNSNNALVLSYRKR